MRRLIAILVFGTLPLGATSFKQAVIGSMHDLTATGGGPVKSAAVGDVCIFCHAPHNLIPNVTPLWNHTLSIQSYATYSSSTYTSGPEAPGAGSSKLCLSCHDGTVASGVTVAQGVIPTSGSMTSADVLGTNLSTSHPVSMTPANNGSLYFGLFSNPPSTADPAVKLSAGKVECVTCHDPHAPRNDPAVPMFLARSNAGGALCLACHSPTGGQLDFMNGWSAGAHASFTNTVPAGATFGPYGNVAANACSSCHNAHNNGVAPRSLKAAEEAGCAPCHNGGSGVPALRNVMAEFSKSYVHPTLTVSGVHDPAEAIPVNSTRHAECADCHNPHTASAQVGTAVAPSLDSSLTGVTGYDSIGVQRPAATEYQICYKCHADSINKPTSGAYGRTSPRYPAGPMPAGYPIQPPVPPDQYNLRLKFQSVIGHNVTGSAFATTANTSLRPYMLDVNGLSNTSRPLSKSTLLYCTDCHNSDQARSSNGTGPNGPHGSAYPHLLQFLQSQDSPGGGGGGASAALCNKCHNLTTVRNIRPHDDHDNVACTTCHDPHGVIGGSTSANRAMMNFDTAIAAKASTYFGYFYLGTGSGQKGCYTNCHGENHNPRTY